MQINDALNRYNAGFMTTDTAPKEVKQAEGGMKTPSGPLSGLPAGTVFEGTVGSVKNGQVQLLLSDGSAVSARMGADLPLTEGESLFFEVKRNEGSLMEIRPFDTAGGLSNPTILSALDAAGLRATPEHMKMVKGMMEENLSIDKKSLGSMARLLASHPEIEPKTLIEMNKLGIPITNEMANQFENYKTDSHQILNKMSEILTEVSGTLGGEETSGEEAIALNEKLVSILLGEEEGALEDTAEGKAAGTLPEQGPVDSASENASKSSGEAAALEDASKSSAGAAASGNPSKSSGMTAAAEGAAPKEAVPLTEGKETALPPGAKGEAEQAEGAFREAKSMPESPEGRAAVGMESGKLPEAQEALLKDVLPEAEQAELREQLKTLDQGGILKHSSLSFDMTAKEFASALSEALKELPEPDEKALKNLLSGKGYLSVLKEVTKDQWTVKPEQLSGDRIKDLYENLDRQMKQTEHVLREMGMKDSELARSVSDLKNNLEFMDQVNQNYTYLQIPFQLRNQNAHSDLYVYTNKKNLNDPNAELTAFLHLDMAHLGSTDISVRMKNRAVNTKFYLEDDAAFDLIMDHAEELQRRLEEKGYHCSVDAVNDAKEVNFVEDFLKAGEGAASSRLIHRYSFDIRA